MFYRITSFNLNPSTKDAYYAWGKSLKPRLIHIGANALHMMEYGEKSGAVIAYYPTEELADAASDLSKQIFGEAIAAGHIDQSSLKQMSGPVTLDFLS